MREFLPSFRPGEKIKQLFLFLRKADKKKTEENGEATLEKSLQWLKNKVKKSEKITSKSAAQRNAENKLLYDLYTSENPRVPSPLVLELLISWPLLEIFVASSVAELLATSGDSGVTQEKTEAFALQNDAVKLEVSCKKIVLPYNLTRIKVSYKFIATDVFNHEYIARNQKLPPHHFCTREQTYQIYSKPEHPTIHITGYVFARNTIASELPLAWGLPTALLRLSHTINRVIIDSASENQGLKFEAEATIADATEDNWSSRRALEIGYESIHSASTLYYYTYL